VVSMVLLSARIRFHDTIDTNKRSNIY